MKRIYKDQQFKVRLTKQQLAALRAAAKREGLSPTQWARSVLMAKCLALGPDEESRLRDNTVNSAPSPRSSDNRDGWSPKKRRRSAVRTADGRTSVGATAAVRDAAKGRKVAA